MAQLIHAAMIVQRWDFEFEDQQRDDDGKDAVAERLDTGEAQFAVSKAFQEAHKVRCPMVAKTFAQFCTELREPTRRTAQALNLSISTVKQVLAEVHKHPGRLVGWEPKPRGHALPTP